MSEREIERILQEEQDEEKVLEAIERWLSEPDGEWYC